MQVKCGIDIIEINRIKESIEDLNDKFLNRVYTQKEIEYCESKGMSKYEHYAARFAVKEAAYKAIYENLKDKFQIGWKNIETINDKFGRPKVKISGVNTNNIENIDVSISHCREYATASVVILFN